MLRLRSSTLRLTSIAALAAATAGAQTLQLATTAIADKVATPEQSEIAIDLRQHFRFDGVTGQLVQVKSDEGIFLMEMMSNDAPNTVARFLQYVDAGDYDDMLVHRSAPGFVIQTGNYNITPQSGGGGAVELIVSRGQINNEFKLSNKRGTVAMAKVDGQPNSATTNWFINLADNSAGAAKLDTANGGYTVFARVIGTGMAAPDEIAKLGVYDLRFYGWPAPFAETPLDVTFASQFEQFVMIEKTSRIATYPAADISSSAIGFTVTNSNPQLVAATLSGSSLNLDFDGTLLGSGSATITVAAKDANGNVATLAFGLTATPFARVDLTEKSVGSASGAYTLAVDGNASWTASSDAPWVSLSTAAGSGDGSITVSYEANHGLFDRAGELIIGDDTHTITQGAARFGEAQLTYAQWVEANFAEGEHDDILASPDVYDEDGDGLPIGIEFALGLDDQDPRSTFSARIASEDNQLYLVVSPTSPAVAVELLASSSLSAAPAAWEAVEGAPQETRGDALWILIEEEDSSFYRARLSLVGVE